MDGECFVIMIKSVIRTRCLISWHKNENHTRQLLAFESFVKFSPFWQLSIILYKEPSALGKMFTLSQKIGAIFCFYKIMFFFRSQAQTNRLLRKILAQTSAELTMIWKIINTGIGSPKPGWESWKGFFNIVFIFSIFFHFFFKL